MKTTLPLFVCTVALGCSPSDHSFESSEGTTSSETTSESDTTSSTTSSTEGSGGSVTTASTSTESESSSSSESTTSSSSSSTEETLPDLTGDIDPDASMCETNGDGELVSGAKTYIWGEMLGSSMAGWTGTEVWYLFQNTTALDEGAWDCIVQWDITATNTTVTEECVDCDIALDVTGTVNTTETTCPEIIWESSASFSVPFQVDQLTNGIAVWYVGDYNFGQGYWLESGDMNYLGGPSCYFY